MWLWFCGVLFAYYLYMRLSRGFNRSATCLTGKTALVTGANSGLGYQTALNLASRGCRIIMADVANMEESKNNIIKYTNNSNLVTKYVDFGSLKSVREFAADIVKSEEKLDILVNNAGLGITKGNRTEDGLHPAMQINYFSHFLLTHLLLDLLKKSAPSRIVFTSSCMAFLGNLSVENLNYNEETSSSFERFFIYCNSKLALLIASDIFAKKLEGTGVTSNAVNPGFTTTPLFRKSYDSDCNPILSLLMRLYNLLYSKDPWEGSQTLVHVAVSKKLEKVTGKYFWDCNSFYKPWKALNKEFCRKIWEKSEKYVQLRPEEKL